MLNQITYTLIFIYSSTTIEFIHFRILALFFVRESSNGLYLELLKIKLMGKWYLTRDWAFFQV